MYLYSSAGGPIWPALSKEPKSAEAPGGAYGAADEEINDQRAVIRQISRKLVW